MSKTVSVIIPCYNAASYLNSTLKSIENQTYQDLELILVNDGSKDETLDIVFSFKNRSAITVKVIDGPNGGVSIARNKGILESKGEYISFLDADDCLAYDAIELLVNAIESEDVDIAYGTWDRNDEKVLVKHEANFTLQNVQDLMNVYMKKTRQVAFFNFLYRREIIIDNNINFKPRLKYGEDNLFFWKYVCHIKSAVFVGMPLYWYNNNQQSAMCRSSWDNSYALEAIYEADRYMKNIKFKYIAKFINYMPAKTVISIAKEYAKHGDLQNYQAFIDKYPVRKLVMKLIFQDRLSIAVASIVLGISPRLFYSIINRLS